MFAKKSDGESCKIFLALMFQNSTMKDNGDADSEEWQSWSSEVGAVM